jgi:acyl-CoA thioesterase
MEIEPQHLNSAGSLHGGAIFSLADAALSVAANSHGDLALAIEVSVSFCKAVKEGALVAEAREVARSARLASYRIDVVEEEGGDLVAQLQGTVYRTHATIATS